MNEALCKNIRAYRSSGVFLAFSGGVDSALLLALCVRERVPVTAVTFQTTLHPHCDLENAKSVADKLHAPHLVLEVDEMSVPEILQNPPTAATTAKSTCSGRCRNWPEPRAAKRYWMGPMPTIWANTAPDSGPFGNLASAVLWQNAEFPRRRSGRWRRNLVWRLPPVRPRLAWRPVFPTT